MVYIREASRADVVSISSRLREADRQECLAASGLPPEVALPAFYSEDRLIFVGGIDENPPDVIWGVDTSPADQSLGIIWMMGTAEILNHPIAFLKASKRQIDLFQNHYPILTNCIDGRNEVHIDWLKWLGFSFIRKIEQYGPQSLPFYEFIRIKS